MSPFFFYRQTTAFRVIKEIPVFYLLSVPTGEKLARLASLALCTLFEILGLVLSSIYSFILKRLTDLLLNKCYQVLKTKILHNTALFQV